jgi:hypothetical protein
MHSLHEEFDRRGVRHRVVNARQAMLQRILHRALEVARHLHLRPRRDRYKVHRIVDEHAWVKV